MSNSTTPRARSTRAPRRTVPCRSNVPTTAARASIRAVLCALAVTAVATADLAAQSSFAHLHANEWECSFSSESVCDSQGIGDWPLRGDQYMFASGVQVAARVAPDAGFDWADEVVAAYFYDTRRTQESGRLVNGYFDSLLPADRDAWPSHGDIADFPFLTGRIESESLFAAHLLGGISASDQDIWGAYWDGGLTGADPGLLGPEDGRRAGVLVEQRAMAWNDPYGNQSVIFLVYEIRNITDHPLFRRNLAHAEFDGDLDAVPAAGWRLDSLFVGFAMDPDVTTDASDNHGSALPWLRAAVAWDEDLAETNSFEYPADVFHPPFRSQSPGLVATALLHADPDPRTGMPADLRMISIVRNAGSCSALMLCDALGDAQLWRYLSGHFGDDADRCNVTGFAAQHVCSTTTVARDVRAYQSVGPYTLRPGESVTIVYGIIAAPVLDVPQFVPFVAPPTPTLHPGCHGEAASALDLAAGWTAAGTCPAEGDLPDPLAFESATGSLADRIQVARAFVDAGFVAPFAPEPPEFHLLPADSGVHVIWSPSPTESTAGSGDPFHDFASDPASPLYNPNYREYDVEGYRIYRSIDQVNWRLIAQFDYAGTTFTDVLCETDRDVAAGEPCPGPREIPIADNPDFTDQPLVQYRPGDIVRTSGGQAVRLGGDTVSAGYFDLRDTGVPFVYVDTDVRPGFRYYYHVRAFDVNSHRSGPSSLESSPIGGWEGTQPKSVVVQPAFANLEEGTFDVRLEGADGERLDPDAPLPEIDAETGVFSGPMPPTNALGLSLLPQITTLLPEFRLEIRIDSVKALAPSTGRCVNGHALQGQAEFPCWEMYATLDRDGTTEQRVFSGFTPVWEPFGEPDQVDFDLVSEQIPADSAWLAAAGALPEFLEYTASLTVQLDESIYNSSMEGQVARRLAGVGTTGHFAGGARWFDGEQETVPDPARFVRVGHLAGVDTVWSLNAHHVWQGPGLPEFEASGAMQYFGYVMSGIARVADFRVTWQGGSIAVEDVTHAVPVAFAPTAQQNWGFVRDGNGNGLIDWNDFFHIDGVSQLVDEASGGAEHTDSPAERESLSNVPVVMETSTEGISNAAAMTATGRGFGLYINSQAFIFETPAGALPAAGTTWTLRTYHGVVRAADHATLDPSEYFFRQIGSAMNSQWRQLRPPMVPGLRIVYEADATRLEGAPDLARIHTVPDPYYYHSRFGPGEGGRLLRFVNLPPQATVRIFSIAGILVDVIHHDDPASGIAEWDLHTRDGSTAASGVYFFHVTAPDGHERIGRFTIVTSGAYVP